MNHLKSYCRNIITSPHEVEEIVDVLARARNHLSRNHRATCAALIHQAENKLQTLGRGDDGGNGNGQT